MTYIHQISFYQNERGEGPNRALAEKLVKEKNTQGMEEMISYVNNKNKSIASDCLAVLYISSYSQPSLIADYVPTFLNLLKSKNNRMVWGSMIALANIAHLKTAELFKEIDFILSTIRTGTLITEVWGIKLLANLSQHEATYKAKLLPILFNYLEGCRPIDFASRVEVIAKTIHSDEEKEVVHRIIKLKSTELSPAQEKKLKTVLRKVGF